MLQLNLGDKVCHRATGLKGKIIGYGYRRISEGYYLTTVKVELRSHGSIKPIAEDLFDRWKIWHDKRILACSLPYFTNPSN